MKDDVFSKSEKNKESLIDLLKSEHPNVVPFIGAGVSASLKLPDWKGLIDKIANLLKFDHNLFSIYGDFMTLAEYCKIIGKMDELEKQMKANWIVSNDEIKRSSIYKHIIKLNCNRIYTTNYDDFIEKAYDINGIKFKAITRIEDFIHEPNEVEIIKLHGDLNESGSIVIAESDYYDRMLNDSPLDIRLRNDMLDKSFLFLGYSMKDVNVKMLFYKLERLWSNTECSTHPDSYIFLTTPNPVQIRILEELGIRTIIGDYGNRTEILKDFLEDIIP